MVDAARMTAREALDELAGAVRDMLRRWEAGDREAPLSSMLSVCLRQAERVLEESDER